MKILLVTNYQPPHMGGIEFAAGSLKRCWADAGHGVTWITTDVPRGGAEQKPDNIRVPAFNLFEALFQINSPVVNPLAYGRVRDAVKSHDVINVHSFAPGLSTLALNMAFRLRKPVVVTQHVGVIPLRFRFLDVIQQHVYCRLAKKSVRRGARVTFVGEAVRAWFAEHTGVPPDTFVMTPAGIDQHSYPFVDNGERETFRRKWDLGDKRLNVLFVGRFFEKKGVPLIGEVAAACPNIRFTLVGNGPVDPKQWGLSNVHLIGFVSTEELRELYGAHDLFIMPSFGEGWPAVVPQAMACGLPCLISEETFQGFKRDAERFLVAPRTAADVTRAIQDAAAGRVALLKDRRGVSEYACRTWDWRRTAEIYLKLFDELL